MKYLNFIISILLLFSALLYFTPDESNAQWSTEPANNLIVGYGLNTEMCSDSTGGCYIMYESGTLGYPRQLTLTRLNRYGYKPWGIDIQISGVLPEQWMAKITPDGFGGVIVCYLDDEFTGNPEASTYTGRLRLQRVDSTGHFLWDSIGIRVSSSETNQGDQSIVSDCHGGCIVAWVDTLGDLRINHIDSLGIRVWSDSGKYIWNSATAPPLISDRNGGCYIVYGIGRLQRFDQDGNNYWPMSGVLVPMGAAQFKLDPQGDVYLFGAIFLGVHNGIYSWTKNIQKISPNGNKLWDSLGVVIDTETTNNPATDYSLVVDTNRIAHALWGNNTNGTWTNYIQNIRQDGSLILPQKHALSGSTIYGTTGYMVKSEDDKVICMWADSAAPYGGILGQCYDSIGRKVWDSSAVLITNPVITTAEAISDMKGGIIIAGGEPVFTIRAQQVSRNGKLGEIVTSVKWNRPKTLPSKFVLYQNYPNPFNSSTIVRYTVPTSDWVRIDLYTIIGQQIATVVNTFHTPGSYQLNFSASDLPSGTYFYVLRGRGAVLSKKFTVLK